MEGILPLFKPKGMTSHDCVFKLRKILKTRKIGHTGTLDPDVTGVLPICIGRATKVAEYITDAGKSYEAEVTIGFSTTTEDATGELVEEKRIERPIKRKEILDVLNRLTGTIQQTPPMYSAVKVKGKRLYEYARQGIVVDRPTREVQIYSMELMDEEELFSGDQIRFHIRVSCSKGTYIRTLAVMIGEEFGYPAHMSKLIRTKSASITLKDCFTFEEIENTMREDKIQDILYPIEMALSHLPKYELNDTLAEKVKNGAVLPAPAFCENIDGPINMMTHGMTIALYIKHPQKQGLIKPVKVLRNE
ncbi:tRNA pseudouridine(55) synthase TruB [Bacillus sp. 03113]|uniref:tRNA pseudouridine(55) synthase TruB n=1 Tax=Bacillus sp. 03113 TaxID=2578211 RepID=UPI0011425A66|nr:tRNA pseudouridine(55) synthase TruB [Bacillus sp. 03113]